MMKLRSLYLVSILTIGVFSACAKATNGESPALAQAGNGEPAAVAAAPAPDSAKSPVDAVKATPRGGLKNPYKDASAEVIEQGRKKYLSASCNGCHGGGGGGGMCPPLSNDVWVYGSDDDTLFRLITLGSVELTAQTGLSRKGRENVVGPMPSHGQIVKSEDDLWKIISFIRANYRGDPSKKNW